jgi:hypothetical protein
MANVLEMEATADSCVFEIRKELAQVKIETSFWKECLLQSKLS